MCEYCGKYGTEAMLIVQQEDLTAMVDHEGKQLIILDREHHKRTDADINYCPMCGRKL